MKLFAAFAFAALAVSGCAVNVRPSERPTAAEFYEIPKPAVSPQPRIDSERLEKQRKIRALLRDIRGERI